MTQTTSPLNSLIRESKVIISTGSGGVGKTTVAAAIGLKAAQMGFKTCVLTIDPAKRLASALGIDNLTNKPIQIDVNAKGELWALMLDSQSTFNDLIKTYSSTVTQAEKIYNNKLYQSLTSSLGGTQEYMAAEKLFELVNDTRFDLIVVDTPPSRNALDFLHGPQRLAKFLENKVFRLLMVPTRTYLKAVSYATQSLLKTIAKVAGSELVNDAIEFFRAFDGMERGFAERASLVKQLLEKDTTSFVVVSSPLKNSTEEASYFFDELKKLNVNVKGLIINKIHPHFIDDKLIENLNDTSEIKDLVANLVNLENIAKREDRYVSDLTARVGDGFMQRIPLLNADVHDIATLEILASKF
jgi:anion-transporting  ArsA/GET3 family ATPase